MIKLVAFCVFHFLRLSERVLPLSVLSFLLWPLAAVWDLLHLRQRTPLTCWRRFPESRCRLEGGSNYIGPREGKRAVVGVSLHFGPVATLPYWLRAHGIVLTSVRTPAIDSLQGLTNYQFSLSPPADVPVFLSTSEIGLSPRLSSIRKILGPTGRLGMLVDVDRGKQFYVRFEDRLFRMATGPIRLAQMLNAELVPVLIVETSTWKYTIHFGTPVPQHYLGSPPDMQAIGTHLLQEFSKVITRHPEQCNMRLLRAMCPLPENGVADLSAVIQTAENP